MLNDCDEIYELAFFSCKGNESRSGGKGDRCIFSLNNRGICGKMKHDNRGVLRVSKWGIESIFGFFGVSAAVLSVAVFFGDPTDLFVRCD